MKTAGVVVLTVLGCVLFMILLAAGGAPQKTIAENCKEKFAYDQSLVVQCLATAALQQANARDEANAWKIQQVIRESR